MIEEQFAGAGLGRKTLSQVCEEVGVDIVHAKERLSKNNIHVKDDEILKNVAARYDIYPIEILKIILVNKYSIK